MTTLATRFMSFPNRSRGFAATLIAALLLVVVALLAAPRSATAATEIQRVVSPGGVEAWLVEERAIPIISIELGFKGGASRETAEEAGLATMLSALLDEGAGPYDATAFAKRADEVAARIGFGSSRDTFTASATMLLDQRDETLELFRLAMTEPRFDAEPLARVKAQMISQIKQAETDPDSIAARAWFSTKFPDDAYGRPRNGTVETVEAITPEDLRAALPRFLNRSTMKVGVVGAISAEELGPLLDTLLSDLSDTPLPDLPEAKRSPAAGIEVIEFEAPQSTVIFGHGGLKRSDPEFIPAYVMNYILGGGGFASRLMVEVREKRGLAYGVYSYLSPLDRAGLYLGGVGTANDRVAESIDVIRAEWAKLAAEGLSEDDLDNAKRYLTGSYPLRFDSNGKIANFLVGAQLEDLGIDYIEKRNGLVEAVTLEDVQRVAARILKPEELYFVVVGQPERLEAD